MTDETILEVLDYLMTKEYKNDKTSTDILFGIKTSLYLHQDFINRINNKNLIFPITGGKMDIENASLWLNNLQREYENIPKLLDEIKYNESFDEDTKHGLSEILYNSVEELKQAEKIYIEYIDSLNKPKLEFRKKKKKTSKKLRKIKKLSKKARKSRTSKKC